DQETLLEAIQFQKQVIRRYPNDTHHHLELAQLYELLGEKKSMQDSVLKAEELNSINKKHGHTDRVFTPQEQEILLKLKAIVGENPNKSE
ncbi:MAG: hypothetical protein JKY95_15145, partial [Planctomycetaceae bacterium]|nr:hypothetical protein [Planctomycetaceae bacterium]